MKTIRVVSVIGTRPEAVKMAPLFMELRSRKEIELKLVVTGQHKEMLNQVLESFEIEVDVNLHIMKHKQSLTSITVDSIAGLEPVLRELNPHIVLVHGDTTTTLAASLAAFYQQIQIGHVEAGLRTGEKFQPYPEEMNRKLTGALADWHYAPTFKAKENLLKEKVDENTIILTGNTAIDALEYTIKPHYTHPLLSVIGGNRFLVLTTHRRENVGAGMREVFFAVKKLLTLFPDLHIVYPVHKNPKIHEIMKEMAINHERLHLTEPLDTVAFHNIASRASIILTDSGGIQEEAPSFGVPVLVLREQTERPEGVEAGVLKLVGTDSTNIIKHVAKLLSDPNEYKMMSNGSNPYGDGKASQRIADHIVGVFFELEDRRDTRPMKSFYSISTLVAVMALSMVFLFQGDLLLNLITLVILLILLVVIAVIPTRFIFPAALSAILVFGFFLTGWNLLSESAPAQTELIVHHLLFTLFVISSWLFFSQAKTIVQVNKELMSLVHYLKKYEPNTNLLTNSEFEERVNIMLTGMKRRKEPGFLIHLVPKYQSYARVTLIDSLSQAILKTIRTNYDLVTYNSDGSFSLFLQNTNESGVKTVLTRLESNASDFLTIEQSPYTVHLYEMIDYNLKKSSKFLDQKRMEA